MKANQMTEDITKQRLGFTGDELRARLKQYDRSPFMELLAKFIECVPTEDALRAFARKNPDKWVNAIFAIQRMSGYTEKTETTVNMNLAVAVGRMSDSQLEDKLREMGIDPGALAPPQLELEAETAPPVIDNTDPPRYLRSTKGVAPAYTNKSR